MKDDIDISRCESIEELQAIIDDYMNYYNTERYQWRLAKLSPDEYYTYCQTEEYPIRVFG